jgi:NADH-quinone oxidoreductase subunit A
VALALRWWAGLDAPGRVTASQALPFRGGFPPKTHARSRFHARYYPMTLVLVAFEMEMMFMYPWAVVYVRKGLEALVDMALFLGILSIGVLYAWREGAFRWQRPRAPRFARSPLARRRACSSRRRHLTTCRSGSSPVATSSASCRRVTRRSCW